MRVTKWTRTKTVLPYLTKENFDLLLEKVPEHKLKKDIISMRIKEFAEIIMDEDSHIEKYLKSFFAFTAFGKLKTYRRQMKEIMDFIKRYEIKQTQEEKMAAIGIEFPDVVSRMLITVTKFFGLKSFDEAMKVPLSSYLMILQEESSSIRYQRAYSDIIRRETNKPKRK